MSRPSSSDASRNAAFTLVELLVVIAIISLLAALLLPVFGRSKARAQNAVCVSQLRQLGVAARLYADENQEVLPAAELLPTMPVNPAAPRPRICDVLAPFVGKRAATTNAAPIFKCPADSAGRFNQEGSSYEWNTRLNRHRIDETISSSVNFSGAGSDPGGQPWQTNGTLQLRFPPVTTPLLFDYDEFHPRPPKSGKNVVFMDNHVAPLDLSQLAPQ